MTKRTRLLFALTTAVATILTILFINKSRLAVGAGRVAAKPPAVSVAAASRRPVPLKFSVVGVLQAYNDVPVIAETQGKVLERYADVGDRVRKGDYILKVDTLLKYAAYIAAKTASAKSQSDLARFKMLHEEGNLSENELELATLNARSTEAQYLLAKRQYEDALITAPISGEIAERTVDVGMMVVPGVPVATIVDVARLKVTIGVSENRIPHIQKGSLVSVSVDACVGRAFIGTVKHVGPKAGESLLFPVEISIANDPQRTLRAGMTAHLTFDRSAVDNALLIPRIGLLGSTREGKVYVVEGGVARLRPVAVGSEFGTDIEIVDGLREGEMIVTVGTNTVHDGEPVTVAP